MKFEIKHKLNHSVLFSIEAGSMKLAVEAAIKSFANLRSADLSSADLSSADLSSADLSFADLSFADLSFADLSSANLSSANLSSADLSFADLSSANLSSANLRSADLRSANLSFADLSSANLGDAKNLRLPTGETWKEYLNETVPALLTAGGKKLEEVANEKVWGCHSWTNCPIATAFSVVRLESVPILFRPRAAQFVELFDAHQIPLADVLKGAAK